MIAVTGATGFIGSSICRELLSQGHQLKILVRTPSKAREFPVSGVQLVQGSVTDSAALEQLLVGCRAVIHCAGAVRGRSLHDFYPANVAGVDQLIAAASKAEGKPRVLIMSSLASREPELSNYAVSKFLGEQAALKSPLGVELTVFRPPAVYGPGDREMLPVFQLMSRGLALIPGAASNRVSLVYIDDLVAAAIAWLDAEEVPQEVFTLSDPAPNGYSWDEIIEVASQVFRRKVRPVFIPYWLLNTVAKCNLLLSALFRYQPMLTPGKLRELRHHDWVCGYEELAQSINWRPRVTLEQGLKLTMPHAEKS